VIYMDNAATSWPKPQKVYQAVDKCLREYCANPGRGSYQNAVKSAKTIYRTRESVANLFHVNDPLKVIFTKNCTEALNLAIRGLVKRGEHVITSSVEHNSVIRPLNALVKQRGIFITQVKPRDNCILDPADIEKAITSKTTLIVTTLSSNVTGGRIQFEEIGRISQKYGIPYLLDAAQGAGVIPIDIPKSGIGMLAFPGHKGLLGPQGTGGLVLSKDFGLDSLIQGGTGSYSKNAEQPNILPDGLESGTLNTPGIAGLEQGINHINLIGIENILGRKNVLIKQLFDGLGGASGIKGLSIYSPREAEMNSGIFSFNIEGFECEEVASILNERYGISVRAGLHCAPTAHRILGTLETGCVRVSPGFFTTTDEIRQVVSAITRIAWEGQKNG